MKNRNFLFLRMGWIFSVLLALLPFSGTAAEMRLLVRYAAIVTHGSKSAASARILPSRYAKPIKAQEANGWPALNHNNVVLALPSGTGKAHALRGMNFSERLLPEASATTYKVLAECMRPLDSFTPANTVISSPSASDVAAPIQFQLANSLIYMQASLNGSHPLWVILDTGSSFTVIDESVLRMLGLQFLGEGNAYGPGQGSPQKFAFASHTTLMFAGANLDNQTVASLPLGWFARELGRSVDGFLGSNVFRNYVVEIDYANQTLRLHNPATYSYSGSGQRLPLQFVWDNIPSVRAEVVAQDGTAITGVFIVDSGATTAIWLSKAFTDAHPEFLSAQETIEVPNVVAVGGEFTSRLGRVPAFRLGGFVISMPLTQFSQNTSGIFATPDVAGTIGAQTLQRFKVIFDYPHMEMILEPNEHFSDPSA